MREMLIVPLMPVAHVTNKEKRAKGWAKSLQKNSIKTEQKRSRVHGLIIAPVRQPTGRHKSVGLDPAAAAAARSARSARCAASHRFRGGASASSGHSRGSVSGPAHHGHIWLRAAFLCPAVCAAR